MKASNKQIYKYVYLFYNIIFIDAQQRLKELREKYAKGRPGGPGAPGEIPDFLKNREAGVPPGAGDDDGTSSLSLSPSPSFLCLPVFSS